MASIVRLGVVGSGRGKETDAGGGIPPGVIVRVKQEGLAAVASGKWISGA
jgi:hypothetical protein